MKYFLIRTLLILSVISQLACGNTTEVDMDASENGEAEPEVTDTDDPPSTDTGSTDTGSDDTDETDDTFEREAFSGRLEFTHDGIERRFFLHIPGDLPANAPLVAVMHGYTGSARNIMQYSGLNDMADEHGFAVFYPQGTKDESGNNFFNVGYDFHIDEDASVDDVGFVSALTKHLQETYTLSTDNVFATGMSNGAEMSYLLACKASDIFKAVAPVAGMMLTSLIQECTPTRSMPVFEIHGTDDYVTYLEGDADNDDGWGAYPDTTSIIDFWVNFNDLNLETTETLASVSSWYDHEVVFDRYYSDTAESEVWLYTVQSGGHDWPGAGGNESPGASQAVWSFFSQYITP